MPVMARRIGLVPVLVTLVISFAPAARAQHECADGSAPQGELYICDPLKGSTKATERNGGDLLAEGFRVNGFGDNLLYDWGFQIADFCAQWEVKGISLQAIDNDNHHILEVLEADRLGKSEYCGLGVRVYGPASDPAWHGRMKLKAWCPGGSDEDATPVLLWDGGQWYFFRLVHENGRLTLFRDGDQISSVDTGPFAPHFGRAWLPMSRWVESAFDTIDGTVHRNFMISSDPACVIPDGGQVTDAGTPQDAGSPTDAGTPDVVSYVVAEDHTVVAATPNTHYDDENDLSVQADAAGNPEEEFYLKFIVPAVPGRKVAAAKVKIYCDYLAAPQAAEGGGGGIQWVADNSWSEDTITWNSKPPADVTALSAVGRVSRGQWYAFDVSAAVTGPGTYSFAVISDDSNGSHFLSKEGGAAGGTQPNIELTTVPDTRPDGGTPDAGAPDDAGIDDDSGEGGMRTDAEANEDSAIPVDAGITSDTGTAKDTGIPTDTGPPPDAPAAPDAQKAGAEPLEFDTLGCGCGAL
ncbi:MAG: DNRLRE domain-containing protein [Deltaproteobacteria bacterium]|nr:DNRLRE domain-containing protein [Deltaproteobacteria bacterium]